MTEAIPASGDRLQILSLDRRVEVVGYVLDNFVLVVGNDLGEEVRVPVHVVTKLSFDQRIIDADLSATAIL